MGAVGPFDVRMPAEAEPQPAAITGSRGVLGLARGEAVPGGPGLQRVHSGQLLLRTGLHHLLQAPQAALSPQVHMRWGEPAEAQQHVDRGDVVLLGQRVLGGPCDAVLDAAGGRHRSLLGCTEERVRMLSGFVDGAPRVRVPASGQIEQGDLLAQRRRCRRRGGARGLLASAAARARAPARRAPGPARRVAPPLHDGVQHVDVVDHGGRQPPPTRPTSDLSCDQQAYNAASSQVLGLLPARAHGLFHRRKIRLTAATDISRDRHGARCWRAR